MAAIEDDDVNTKPAEVTRDSKGPIEHEVEAVKQQGKEAQIAYLLNRAMATERTDQREHDVNNDHGIKLFARQKKKSLVSILGTLFLLTLVYLIQVAALYNLNREASLVDTNKLIKWLERGLWSYPAQAFDPANAGPYVQVIRGAVNGSEVSVFELPALGFCLTPRGNLDVVFNTVIGVVMVYLFLFFDLWFVVFDMPLTRNFVSDTHGVIMLLGVVWLVLLNSAIITWLGVISGWAVIANSGDFYSVLFQSLQLFIILVIDDTILPAVRFFVEENGALDSWGNLKDEDLKALTHGSQYYKPGYGHSFVKNLLGRPVQKLTASIALLAMATIIFAPAILTIIYAVQAFVPCP